MPLSRVTPQMRDLAARLIADEAEKSRAPEVAFPPFFYVCEKLRPHLSTLMGRAGFRAVLSRGLAVTSAEVTWLSAVQVRDDGSLEGWDTAEIPEDSEAVTSGGVLLIAHLLGLLVAFIGDNLTLRLVREVWPGLTLEALPSNNGKKP